MSATGADFIEWSWDPADDAGARTSSVPISATSTLGYEVEWAFWEDRIGARSAIWMATHRYRLPVEPDTTAWLRVRSSASSTVAASDWSPAVEGSSPAARCVVPEVTASRPREGDPPYRVRNEITIQRPAGTRRPLVRIRRPYHAAPAPWTAVDGREVAYEPFLAARLRSWIATRDGSRMRDELSFDWPSDQETDWWEGAGGQDAELLVEIVTTGCPDAVTVRCQDGSCTVER